MLLLWSAAPAVGVARGWSWSGGGAAGDQAALLTYADNRNVSRNLRDRFPHPYTPEVAAGWLEHVAGEDAVVQGAPPASLVVATSGKFDERRANDLVPLGLRITQQERQDLDRGAPSEQWCDQRL